MMNPIQVTRSSMPEFEEYVEEIKDLWQSRWLSNRGAKHKLFEEQLRAYLGCPNLSLFANGHVALEIAMAALGLSGGGEVITTPYTHCSTTHCIVRNGLKPVFCDVNKDDLTIDASQIESLITKNTVAIVATHVYGFACDVEAIEKIAGLHKLKVIYDAAHAFGVSVNGVGIGRFGDASMFSCHATKVFQTIEGGIATFRDPDMPERAEALTNFGFNGPDHVLYVSTNARMNEFEAAMGICNLRHIDGEILRRKAVSDIYDNIFTGIEGITLPKPRDGVSRNYSFYPVLFDGFRKSRDEVMEILLQEQIFPRKYFWPLVTELECYADRYSDTVSRTPVAKRAAESVLALPLYADMSVEDAERICNIILG